MSYEAQIAGLGDAPPGRPAYGRAVRAMQRRSLAELLRRRAAAVAAVRAHADLEFVNGGGTGSIAATGSDPSGPSAREAGDQPASPPARPPKLRVSACPHHSAAERAMTDTTGTPVRKTRWLVLAGFSLLVASTQLLVLTFAPVTTQAHQALGVSEGAIGLALAARLPARVTPVKLTRWAQ